MPPPPPPGEAPPRPGPRREAGDGVVHTVSASDRPTEFSYDPPEWAPSPSRGGERENPVRVLRAVRRNYGCDVPSEEVDITQRVQRALDWVWKHGGCRDLKRVPCGTVFQCGEGSTDLVGFWQICSPSTLGPAVCVRGSPESEELEVEWSVGGGAARRRTFAWGSALDLT